MINNQKTVLPLAIIGGGPGGITAAIYAKRSNIEPIIFTHEIIGGKAAKTLLIENYPGISTMNGPEFCEKLEEQIKYLNIKVEKQKVLNIDRIKNDLFQIKTKTGVFVFEKVVIATGARERKHPGKNMEELEGKGVSYCSSCDGYFFKNQNIGVIGDGNSTIEESKVLAQIGKKIIIFNRGTKFNAEPALIDEIKKLKNVEIKYQVNVLEFLGTNTLEGLLIENIITKQKEKVAMKGVFVFIGSLPNNQFINPTWKITDNNGYIITDSNFETKIKNLYAVGDIVSGQFQQYTTAMGSATIALKDIINKGYKFVKI